MLYCTTIFNTIHSSSGCKGGGPSLSTSMLTDMTLAASPTSQVPSMRLFQFPVCLANDTCLAGGAVVTSYMLNSCYC